MVPWHHQGALATSELLRASVPFDAVDGGQYEIAVHHNDKMQLLREWKIRVIHRVLYCSKYCIVHEIMSLPILEDN